MKIIFLNVNKKAASFKKIANISVKTAISIFFFLIKK